ASAGGARGGARLRPAALGREPRLRRACSRPGRRRVRHPAERRGAGEPSPARGHARAGGARGAGGRGDGGARRPRRRVPAGWTAGSVAAAAGFRRGDVVTEAAGAAVASPDDLHAVVDVQAPGTWLPLVVRRGGRTLRLVAHFERPS